MCVILEILQKAQTNECMHLKYYKALNETYAEMGHDEFKIRFMKGLRTFMQSDENNIYANIGLKFCAKYLSGLLITDSTIDTHPLLLSTFEFVCKSNSSDAHVRSRLCQFVNMILSSMGPEATLERTTCSQLMACLVDRLTDASAAVRVQAVNALQRFQLPEDPQDAIILSYLLLLETDPSAAVRVAIVTVIAQNLHTIPLILDRLWDVDEQVRWHTYKKMGDYPIKAYKVVQRIILLEQGLNDESDRVRKMVTSLVLPKWCHSYEKKYIGLIAALKIDSNDVEFKRFANIAKQSLFALFKKEPIDRLMDSLPLHPDGREFGKCVPFENFTLEIGVYWATLIEYLQSIDEDDDHPLHERICDLSTFCDYLDKFYSLADTIDLERDREWIAQENRYKAYILMDILITLDAGDETGRKNFKSFVAKILSSRTLEEEIIKKLVLATENVIRQPDERLQFFVDIVRSYTDRLDGSIDLSKQNIGCILNNVIDADLKMKITQLRLEILDLRERKITANEQKDYHKAHDINENLIARNDELLILLNEIEPLNAQMSTATKKMTNESTIQCLQICFYAVTSKHLSTLTPNMCQLYMEFIRIKSESNIMAVRDWALKCHIAFSLKYEQLAKDAYIGLMNQFNIHYNTCIWTTSIKGVFELVDKYGFLYFEGDADEKKFITLFEHLLNTCEEISIVKAIVIGFCRLVLSGRLRTNDLVSKLLLTLFSPTCDPEMSQILAIFFQALIKRKQHKCLVTALLPTLYTIWNAPSGTPLREVKSEEIIKFVVNSTVPVDHNTAFNIHNVIALLFLSAMNDNSSNKDLLKLLSKELLTLHVSTDTSLRSEYQSKTQSLLQSSLGSYVDKNIEKFQEIFAGSPKQRNQRRY